MLDWKLVKSVPRRQNMEGNNVFPFLVQTLDDKQEVVRYSTRRYSFEEDAMASADALNKLGYNVQVLQELAFCINEPKGTSS